MLPKPTAARLHHPPLVRGPRAAYLWCNGWRGQGLSPDRPGHDQVGSITAVDEPLRSSSSPVDLGCQSSFARPMPWKTRAYRWIEKIEHLARGARQPPGTPWTPNLPAQEPAGQKAGQPLNAQGFRGGGRAPSQSCTSSFEPFSPRRRFEPRAINSRA